MVSPTPNTPPPVEPRHRPVSGAVTETAVEVVHAAEVLVERAVVAAERSLMRRIGLRGLRVVLAALRALGWLAVLAYFVFCLTFLATRYYVLPHIGDWRNRIEDAASGALQASVSIGHLEADWDGLDPRLVLQDVTLKDRGGETALALPKVEVVLSWTTLLAWQPRVHTLTVFSPEIEVRRLHDRNWTIAGFSLEPQQPASDNGLLDWVLAQRYISVRDARVHFVDEAGDAPAIGASTAAPSAAAAAPAALAPAPAAAPVASTAPMPVVPDAATAAQASPPSATARSPGATPAPAPAPAEALADLPAAPPARQIEFTDVNLLLTHGLRRHRLALRLRPPADLAGPVDLRAELTQSWRTPAARLDSWSGRLFAEFTAADLARLDALTHLVPAPAHIEQATGALRAWIDFAGARVQRVRADVALTDVAAQLRPDLDPLRLRLLEGRLTQSEWTDGDGQSQEIALSGLHMEGGPDVHLPPTDLLMRTTRGPAAGGAPPAELVHVEASRIVLGDWSHFARQLPLPADWLALIERTAARGTLEDLRANWGGSAGPGRVYALRTRFSGLGFTLGPAAPAAGTAPPESSGAPAPADTAAPTTSAAPVYTVENLAGNVDLDQRSGSLRLDTNNARLGLPALFDNGPLALDTLAARVRWTRESPTRLAIDVDAFSAANADLDVNATGAYAATDGEPARLDLSGRVTRARLNALYRYVPRVTAAPARAWIRGALIDGNVTEGAFYLHGDPRRFPFADPHDGEFHAALHVQEARMDVAPRVSEATLAAGNTAGPWPQLSAIDGDVIFDRNRVTINATRARAYGYELSGISGRVADLDKPDQHLRIEAQGSGPLAEILRYLAASPVNGLTGGWLGSSEASGPARLKMRLDVPLAHSIDTTVAGSLALRNDNLTLRQEVAPFTGLTGELGFTHRGVEFNGLTAGYLGGEVRVNGRTLDDGTIEIQANGSATGQGAKRQIGLPLLRHLLDHTRGSLHYATTVTIRRGTLGLLVDSDLGGLAVDLPEPFRKAAAELRPLHVEFVPVAGAAPLRDTVRVTLAKDLGVELHRVAAGDSMHIERGAVAIGAKASVPDAGLLLLVDLPHVDVDRWQRLLALNAPAGSAADTLPTAPTPRPAVPGSDTDALDLLVVHAGDLTVSGKTLTNVSLSARRDPEQGWFADIDADQASGAVHWTSAHGTTPGRAVARLAKLSIPETEKKQVSDLLDAPPGDFPALDIVVDQLDLGASKVGRLELEAQNTTVGGNNNWLLQKLVVTNPDGKLTGTGSWQREGVLAGRKMSLKVALSFSNAGGILTRFGLPGTIKNGSGKLEGDLAWRGSPLSIDYPSLSGKLHLQMEKGQFLKAEAGAAGRLLGVFSLQSLAHRVTGDFSDIFGAGFAFDSIGASATIVNGNLSTDDFIMKGLNAVVRVKGEADLNGETQNLEVVVIPEINTVSASLGLALVNPAIGLGSFVANYVLRKPLTAALTKYYQITGSWSDPQVKKVATAGRPDAAPQPAAGDKPAS